MRTVSSDTAYEHIRKRILRGDYPPGYALMTNALSLEIGVSRTPVRDALRLLEADGLVVIKPRLGARVKAMELKEYREVCAMRLALESHAAGLAAQLRTETDLHEIRLALEAMRRLEAKLLKAVRGESLMAELVREDIRFHIAIMTAAKNDLMKKEILRLHLINRVVSGPSPADHGAAPVPGKAEQDAHRRAVLASHEEIFEAIAIGNPVAARSAMERHIQDIIDGVIRRMAAAATGKAARALSEEELAYTT